MKKIFIAITALCSAFALTGCDNSEKEFSSLNRVFFCMNTNAELVVSDRFTDERVNSFEKLCSDVETELRSLEASLAVGVADSSVNRFNEAKAGATVEIDANAYEVLTLAKEIYTVTDGYYNPAVYYSVQAFGFNESTDGSLNPEDRIPSDADIEKYRALSLHFGETEIYTENNKFYAKKPEATFIEDGETFSMKVDLGGIGKGYAADRVNAIIDSYAFKYGFFSFGSSSIICKQHYLNGEYKLGMQNPRAAGNYAGISISDISLSTSGDYQQYFLLDGVRYSHVFDPMTGKPVQSGIMTATIIGGTAAEGDALTTALMAMGKEKAVSFINEKLTDVKVVFTYDNGGKYEIITNVPDELAGISEYYKIVNSVSDGAIILGEK